MLTPGGAKAVAAENIALRKQLISLSRRTKRTPKLSVLDRIIYGFLGELISPKRLSKIAIIISPSTIIKFHKALNKRKYHAPFSNKTNKKPGRKGPSKQIIDAIVEMKKRNPSYGYRRIAMQITMAFGIDVDKDVVRRVLKKRYGNSPENQGPSWLTFIGQMKDSLWSVDLLCCESINMHTHWVMVVMDPFTRRIIGFAAHKGSVSGVYLCCMFNKIVANKHLPKYLSSDNDPLFTYHQWKANLRIFEIDEIKSIPYTPVSHPFVERLIGTVRREFLDQILFWNKHDLAVKLKSFQDYYNNERGHSGIKKISPSEKSGNMNPEIIELNNYRWKKHCRGLFQLPKAA